MQFVLKSRSRFFFDFQKVMPSLRDEAVILECSIVCKDTQSLHPAPLQFYHEHIIVLKYDLKYTQAGSTRGAQGRTRGQGSAVFTLLATPRHFQESGPLSTFSSLGQSTWLTTNCICLHTDLLALAQHSKLK